MTTETKLYNLSSGSADNKLNGSMNSQMYFYIPNFIQRNDSIKNIYFSVYSAEVPNSFYLVNQYNNVLYIQSGVTITTYTLAIGNYTITTLLAALKVLLGSSYTLTFNSINLTLTITNSSTFIILGTSTITRILGLSTVDTTSTLISGVYSFTTPYVINLLPYQKLHFRSNALQLDNYNTFDKSSDVFLSLQNSSVSGSGIYYKNNSRTKFVLDIDNVQMFDIRISDEKNRLIDFNNCEWFLTIQIDYEYIERLPKTNLSSLIYGQKQLNEDFIKYQSETWTNNKEEE